MFVQTSFTLATQYLPIQKQLKFTVKSVERNAQPNQAVCQTIEQPALYMHSPVQTGIMPAYTHLSVCNPFRLPPGYPTNLPSSVQANPKQYHTNVLMPARCCLSMPVHIAKMIKYTFDEPTNTHTHRLFKSVSNLIHKGNNERLLLCA